MMEKNWTDKELDTLLRNWSEETLPPEEDSEVTERLLSFLDEDIENDDNYIEEMLSEQVHRLAEDERHGKRRKLIITLTSVAASLTLLIAGSISIFNENTSSSDNRNMIASLHDTTIIEPVRIITDTIQKISLKKQQDDKALVAKANIRKSKPTKHEEILPDVSTDEDELVRTISEINVSFGNFMESAITDINETGMRVLPENLTLTDNLDSYEYQQNNIHTLITDGVSRVSVIESNLMDALYEIKNLNINLNFETETNYYEI